MPRLTPRLRRSILIIIASLAMGGMTLAPERVQAQGLPDVGTPDVDLPEPDLPEPELPDVDLPDESVFPETPMGVEEIGDTRDQRRPLQIPEGMAAIEAFSDLVEEYERVGYEGRIHRYTYDGAQYFVHAVSALVPKGDSRLNEQREALMRRVDQLEDNRLEEGHTLMIRGTLIEAVELLTAIQEARYPAYDRAMSGLRRTAEAIYPDRPLRTQPERIHDVYRESSRLLMEMAGQSPPRTMARAPRQGNGAANGTGGGPLIGEEVQAFVDFVDRSIEEGAFLNGEIAIYEGLRKMSTALGTLVPMGDTVINDQHRTLESRVDSLEHTHSAPQHGVAFRDTLHDAARLMGDIQQQRFPGLAASVRQVRESAEHIDADRDLTLQGERLESFFLNARRAMEDMEEMRQGQNGRF